MFEHLNPQDPEEAPPAAGRAGARTGGLRRGARARGFHRIGAGGGWRCDFLVFGRRVCRRLLAGTEAEAASETQALRAAALAEIDRSPGTSRLTFLEAVSEFVETVVRVKDKDPDYTERRLDLVVDLVGPGTPLRPIDDRVVYSVAAALKKQRYRGAPISDNTVRTYFKHLTRVLNHHRQLMKLPEIAPGIRSGASLFARTSTGR